jgi:hypothetical protein
VCVWPHIALFCVLVGLNAAGDEGVMGAAPKYLPNPDFIEQQYGRITS